MKTDTVFFLKRDRCYIFYQRMMTHSAREEERQYVSLGLNTTESNAIVRGIREAITVNFLNEKYKHFTSFTY